MTVYPNWRAGMKVRASDLTQQQIQVISASTTRTVNNSISLVDDTALVVPLLANASYIIELSCAFDNVNTGVGYRVSWSVPTSSTGSRFTVGSTNSSGSYTDETNTKASISSLTHTSVTQRVSGTTDQSHFEWLTITTAGTAGDAQFRFAQQTANASNTTRLVNSFIRVHRVA